jgi:hypothetical protein
MATAEPITTQMPTTEIETETAPPYAPQISYAAPPAPPAGPPPVGYLYPQQPQPPSGNNKGLIIGLSAALLVALAGVLVAVLLVAGGSDNTPTVAAVGPTTSVPAPVSRVTTVIKTVHAKARKRAKKPSSFSSPPSSRSTPIHRTVASASSATDKAEIRNVVEAHWADIERGNYSAAFGLLAPGSQSKSSWISEHQADALTSASISVGNPTVSGSSATVPVLNLHTVADSGCFNWSGSYEMSKIGGSWRIGKAKISRSSC